MNLMVYIGRYFERISMFHLVGERWNEVGNEEGQGRDDEGRREICIYYFIHS